MLKSVQTRTDEPAVTGHTTRRYLHRLEDRVRAFRDDESGVLVAFGVMLFLMMLMVGGIGVDLMRFEYTRTSLQNTLDRAVLAAADLDQTLDAQGVVEDYFAKSELAEYLSSVTVNQSQSYKEVSATAEIDMETQLIHMMGIPTLAAPAAGTAKESIGQVEISLVLDVSGSMGSNSRLSNMKVAAKDFVDLVLENSPAGEVSISLVPYATQVSLGENLMNEYNVTNEHSYSHCIDFIADEFNNTAVLPTEPLLRTSHFDPWNGDERDISNGQSLVSPVCPTDSYADILPLSMDRVALKAKIDSLVAKGNTSIDLGMKWGAAMLDPGSQPVVTNLISDGVIDPAFAGRPKAFATGQNLKIAIIMTDGKNTTQYYMLPPYRDGLTDVWRHQSGKYSVLHGGEWYYPHDNSWHDEPYKDTNGNSSTRLTYPELNARAPLHFNAAHNWAGILGYTAADAQWHYGVMNSHNNYYKNQRLDRVCKAAKEQGIVVYTIAFEAPSDGQRVLEKCASSDAHHFDADGIEISDAFVSIASSISKLRLTQ